MSWPRLSTKRCVTVRSRYRPAMASFTCITCRVAFADADRQRAHYKGDWHRYNLKRKVVDLPPITAENFLQKAQALQAQVTRS